jgi:5-methylthioadenosine/S-adenosylhomocysteine deaminase
MQAVDQIIHARWLLTCEPDSPPLENHALIIKDGIIADILPYETVDKTYSTANITHYKKHAVMPGFINSHTHIAMNYFRGMADDLALMDWLNNHIWPAEKKWVSPEFVYDASELALAEMIRSGTTCFNDMYFFLQDTARAVEIAGIRAHIGITVIGFPTSWAQTSEEYIQKGLAFYNEYKNHSHITTTFAPHSIYTETDATLMKIRDLAEEYNLKINMHVQETAHEIAMSVKATKLRPIRRLQQMGLLTPRLIAVHMAHINEEDLELLAEHKPCIVHCPESNMKLASGEVCPLHEFHKLGLTVALGTDGAASNNDLDMIGEMRTAAFLAKHTTKNPRTLPVQQVLTMATLNGAQALGIGQQTGSLKTGKAADFIAIDLDQIETLPLYNPASQIVFAATRDQVTDVWVAGKQLMRDRKLLTLDEEAIKAKAKQWREKIFS